MRTLATLMSLVAMLAVAGAAAAQPPDLSTPPPQEPVESAAPVVFMDNTAPTNRTWVTADYLLWWIRDSDLPPLVTTGTPVAGDPFLTGSLGRPDTVILFGGSIDNEERSGGRFAVGRWFDDDHAFGLEGRFFFLGERAVGASFDSSQFPVITAPVFDVLQGRERSVLVAFPGFQTGGGEIALTSSLWGLEANGRTELLRGPAGSLGLIGGFRYADLDENLRIATQVTILPTSPLFPVLRASSAASAFDARTQFYGGQIGAAGEYDWRSLFFRFRGQVALGSNHQSVTINAATVATTPDGVTALIPGAGGPLALQSIIGRYQRDRFAVMPEVGVQVGVRFRDRVRMYFGYDFLYWSNVVRPGDQIDRAANISQIPPPFGAGVLVGPAAPVHTFSDTGFWAQGLSWGMELRW